MSSIAIAGAMSRAARYAPTVPSSERALLPFLILFGFRRQQLATHAGRLDLAVMLFNVVRVRRVTQARRSR
jgi:hypothetical protein